MAAARPPATGHATRELSRRMRGAVERPPVALQRGPGRRLCVNHLRRYIELLSGGPAEPTRAPAAQRSQDSLEKRQ